MSTLPDIALSVRQPWAWAIIYGGKDIENRTAAAVRHGMKPGRIAIHASKGMTRDEYESARDFIEGVTGQPCPTPDALIRGAIIGSVTVTGVVSEHESDWFFGPRGLVLDGAAPCAPIPSVGALGYFKWTRGGEIDPPKRWMLPDPPTRSARLAVSAQPDMFMGK